MLLRKLKRTALAMRVETSGLAVYRFMVILKCCSTSINSFCKYNAGSSNSYGLKTKMLETVTFHLLQGNVGFQTPVLRMTTLDFSVKLDI